jgi:hypothetical protein
MPNAASRSKGITGDVAPDRLVGTARLLLTAALE